MTAADDSVPAAAQAAASGARATVAESVGSALLLAAVVGSGLMGDRLSAGNAAIALLANSLATGAALVALLLTFGPVSGAHFNPAVTIAEAVQGGIAWQRAAAYVVAQIGGAVAGVATAHAMFGVTMAASTHARPGPALIFSEFIATFGLVAVVSAVSRYRPTAIPCAVGTYITAAYWFTASTSFATPAATIARALTDTFTGIRPADVPGFLMGPALGATAAVVLFRWLLPQKR